MKTEYENTIQKHIKNIPTYPTKTNLQRAKHEEHQVKTEQ